MTYPAASTPLLSVHDAPNSTKPTLPFTPGQIENIGQKILIAIIKLVIQALVGFITNPAGDLSALLGQLSGWSQGISGGIQSIIDDLLTGLTGTSSTGNEITAVLTALQKLIAKVEAGAGQNADLWAQLQNVGGLMVQVIQELETTPVLLPEDLLGSIWFWFGGLWNTVTQSVSNQNPAYTSLENRIIALEGTTYSGGTPTRVDDFNDPSLPNWAPIGAIPEIQAPNGFVAPSTVFQAGQFTASVPATGRYRVLCGAVNLAYGRSRMVMQANSAFTNFVLLEINRGTSNTVFSLGTASTLNGAMTVFDSHTLSTGGFKEADVLGVEVIESSHEFKSLKNNAVIGVWNDNAGTIGTGTGHRNLALCTNIDSSATLPGCGWEVFSQADIA